LIARSPQKRTSKETRHDHLPHWRKVPSKRELALCPDGAIIDLTDDEDDAKRADAKAGGARIEKRDSFQVERLLITASSFAQALSPRIPAPAAGS
jgi:hypothetical protein